METWTGEHGTDYRSSQTEWHRGVARYGSGWLGQCSGRLEPSKNAATLDSLTMRHSCRAPSIVPNADDRDVYLVLDDFGRLRRAWREADPEDADLDSSIGRYSAPSGLKFPDQRGLTGAVVKRIS